MKILTIFANQKEAGEAIDEINSQETLKDVVEVEVIDADTAEHDAQPVSRIPTIAPLASTGNGGGIRSVPAVGLVSQLDKVVSDFNLNDEERTYIERSTRNNGMLVILEMDDDHFSQIEGVLQRNNARAIHSTS